MKLAFCKVLLILLLCPLAMQAQINKAAEFMDAGKYSEAVVILESARQKGEAVQTDLVNLAYCYIMLHDYVKAEEVYGVVVQDKNVDAKQYFFYGEVLRINGKFNDAKAQYQKYLDKFPDNFEAKVKLQSCDSLVLWERKASPIIIGNEESVNTANDELWPVPLQKDFYYVSNNKDLLRQTGNTTIFTDPQMSFIFKKTYTTTTVLRPFTDSLSYPCFNALNGKLAMVVKSVKRTPDGEKFGNSVIMTASYNGSWKEFKPQGMPEGYVVTHPCFSPDGKRLYFASDIPGGQGGSDLYYSDVVGDSWSAPVNLGTNVNTPGNEMFPQFSHDGKFLYFASDGHAGYGNLDIFRSTATSGGWSSPQNMKSPVNSIGNDFGLIFGEDGYSGYFVSNRYGTSKGGNDIYTFQLPLPAVVVDSTKPPVVQILPTDTIMLFFKTASAAIDPAFNNALLQVAGMMKQYPYLKLNIETYADARGSEGLNNRLCVDRAKAVAAKLSENGVADSRIIQHAKGISKSVNSPLISYHVQIGFLPSADGLDYYKRIIKENVPVATLPYAKGFAYFAGKGTLAEMKVLASKIRTKYGIPAYVTASSQNFYLEDYSYAPCRRAVMYFSK